MGVNPQHQGRSKQWPVLSWTEWSGLATRMHICVAVHTNFSPCSNITIDEILATLTRQIDGLVITDHDFIFNFSDETIRNFEVKYEIVVFSPAVEISTLEGHLLAYGLSTVPSYYSNVKDVIDLIHQERGIAVAAHPFALLGLDDLIFTLDIDAIEINGSRPLKVNQMARDAAESMGLPLIGGSDSHAQFQVGSCVTEFSVQIQSMSDIIAAVKKRNCKPLLLTHRGL